MPTSYNAQDMAIALNDLQENVTALQASHAHLQRLMAEMLSTLQGISHMLSKEYLLNDLLHTETMTTTDIRLDRQGRRFLVIFTPVQITGVTAKVMGITGFTFNLLAGWNVLNMPDGTILNGPIASSQPIVVKATNWVQAGVI